MKKIITSILTMCLAFNILLTTKGVSLVKAATPISDDIYAKQQESDTCTLESTTMMLRSRAFLNGYTDYKEITEHKNRYLPNIWIEGVGLKWFFNYYMYEDRNYTDYMHVIHIKLEKGITENELISLLSKHPEGVLIYHRFYNNEPNPHAIFITDYDEIEKTFYASDPSNRCPEGRIKLSDTTIGERYNGNVSEILKNTNDYWCIDQYCVDGNYVYVGSDIPKDKYTESVYIIDNTSQIVGDEKRYTNPVYQNILTKLSGSHIFNSNEVYRNYGFVPAGWNKIVDKWYYYSLEWKDFAIGFYTIGTKEYYFDPDTRQLRYCIPDIPENGWREDEGEDAFYYYENYKRVGFSKESPY